MEKFTSKVCLLFGVLFCIALSVRGQRADWDYPIKPGSEAWSKLADVQERVKACQIPPEILSQLSSTQLVKLCKTYPYFEGYVSANNPLLGFRRTMEMFNGYNELLAREDGYRSLIKHFDEVDLSNIDTISTSIGKGQFALSFHGIEMMLSNQAQAKKLSQVEKIALLKLISRKHQEKIKHGEELISFGRATTAFLVSQLSKELPDWKKEKFKESDLEEKQKSFEEQMMPLSGKVVDRIIQELDQYVITIK